MAVDGVARVAAKEAGAKVAGMAAVERVAVRVEVAREAETAVGE